MKNPLIPTYKEREHAPDKFDMEHNADLRLMMPDFDESLRAHEEKHDPLNEFTKDSLMMPAGSGKVTTSGSADLTVGLTGIAMEAKAGTVYVLNAETGRFTITGHPPTVSIEQAAVIDNELERIAAEIKAKHKLDPTDVVQVRVYLEPEIEAKPVPLFDRTAWLLDFWPDKEMRLRCLKRLSDEANDLQPLIAAGRHNVVLVRRVCTCGWVVKQAAIGIGAPLFRLAEKVPGLLWAVLVWLFTKP